MRKALLVTILLSCLAALSDPAVHAQDDMYVVGYYPAWVKNSFPAERVDFKILTHIIHAFAWPEKDGTIAVWKDFHYPELIEATHKAGRKISVAFGGWGNCEGFPPVAADPKLRAAFIKNALEFCDTYGYDGIDLDWEFPASPKERDDLTTLVSDLRKAISAHKRPLLITMAISAGSWSADHNDYAALNGLVDWYNNMTYDFYGTWSNRAGHNAPLYASQESVDASMRFLMRRQKVPAEKLALGVPFYGRRFKAKSLYGPSTGGDGITYKNIVPLFAETGWVRLFDDVSMSPYIKNDRSGEMVFFDDPESIARKCQYAREQGFRGVMIWSLGSDDVNGRQELLEAIGTGLKK